MSRFSTRRLLNAVRWESAITLSQLPKIFAIILMLCLFSFWSAQHGADEIKDVSERVLLSVLSACYVYVYRAIEKFTTRMQWLMYPGGAAEKFLGHVVYTSLLMLAMSLIAIPLADCLQYAIHWFTGIGLTAFITPYLVRDLQTMLSNPASCFMLLTVLLFYHSVFLATAQFFNKQHGFFTVLSLLGVSIACLIVFYAIADSVVLAGLSPEGSAAAASAFLWLFIVPNYLVSYASFRDLQLVDSGWINF